MTTPSPRWGRGLLAARCIHSCRVAAVMAPPREMKSAKKANHLWWVVGVLNMPCNPVSVCMCWSSLDDRVVFALVWDRPAATSL